jgi:nucleoside-diphosphate-sugar epimerase
MIPSVSTDQTNNANGLLITGATGFIGMEVLARFLEKTDRRVHVLVRAADEREADLRVRSTLGCLFGREDAHRERVVAVPGDIQSPDLGMDRTKREWLAENVSDVIHSAASVSFSLPIDQSRDINVTGTERVLDFANLCRQRGGLDRFSYISTAYVAGTHGGEFREDQLDVGQDFRNPYERSKFEAESLVRRHQGRLPIQIFRPSIVVGEQTSGWTASFNVLYSPLQAFARGALPAVPARRSAPVLGGDTFHLVAGDRATTVGRLIDLSADHLGKRRPMVIPPGIYQRFVLPVLLRRGADRLKSALERMSVFFPYFAMDVAYRNDEARSRLEPAGVSAPPIEAYFDRLLDYAIEARWGKVALPRSPQVH